MANYQESGCTFEWKVSNISYCWMKKGEPIESTTFCASNQSGYTTWSLILYPRGIVDDRHVGIYLRRENDVFQRKIIKKSFQFAFLNKKGSCLKRGSVSNYGFDKGSVSGIGEFLEQDKLFGAERETFFPEDTLIVQCTLWLNDEMPNITENEYMALTDFKINRRNFFWRIDGFNTLCPWKSSFFEVRNEFKKMLVRFHLELNFKREICLKIISWDECIKSFSFKIDVVDSEKRKVSFGKYIFLSFECGKQSFPLFSTEQLLQNKSRYLPNDVLILHCEYGFSTGSILHLCEDIRFGITSPFVSNEVIENVKTTVVSNQNEPRQAQALVDDLKCLYNDAVHCDIDLRTSTKTFPAHKTILSARSSVFCRMFSNDMREKNTGHVDIPDLEDETVHQMLLYIYTDSLDDLQFESASKLYSAADKYAIFSLKERCSCFLKDNISPTKVCDLLNLADRHQDDDLKSVVQDYILANDKEVFCTPEWKEFMVNNIQLAADVMYRKLSQN